MKKFCGVIGNPPYQGEASGDQKRKGTKRK